MNSASASPRRSRPDLLTRVPSGVVEADRARWAALVVDPVAQLEELDDLVVRGLVSPDEFARLKARIISRAAAITWATAGEPPPRPEPAT